MNLFRKRRRESAARLEVEQARTRAAYPHCDSLVLHRRGQCVYCDEYPDWQLARAVTGIPFTGEPTSDGGLADPATQVRPLELIEQWPGNRAKKS